MKGLRLFKDFLEKYFREITLVCLTALIMSLIGGMAVRNAEKKQSQKLEVAQEYIKELESSIDETTLLDVIAEGDAYCNYYNK